MKHHAYGGCAVLRVRYGLRQVTATSLATALRLASTAVAGLLFGAAAGDAGEGGG